MAAVSIAAFAVFAKAGVSHASGATEHASGVTEHASGATEHGTSAPGTGTRPGAVPGPRQEPPRAPARRARRARRLLTGLLALAAVPLLALAHEARPAPFGDRLTLHARGADDHRAVPLPHGWSYARDGHRPLAVVPARGHAVALWDDGLVTATTPPASARHAPHVRWHRALPDAAPWLTRRAARPGAGVLRVLGPDARMLAVVTPRRITAYRVADGDLRWVLPAREGCRFEPARAARVGHALLIAQPCTGRGREAAEPWTAQLVAVDDIGRIVPRRNPLGNDIPGSRPRSVPGPTSAPTVPEKVVARPR
ncbi:hypothetical protein ACIQNU_07895 [Streptomyces sp. NPDC091292]|uniref:hypothetical protein n=1 Tax=Streptomyces sp. NPDC091292 TaxID=3365991 RepID=UPI0037F30ECC